MGVFNDDTLVSLITSACPEMQAEVNLNRLRQAIFGMEDVEGHTPWSVLSRTPEKTLRRIQPEVWTAAVRCIEAMSKVGIMTDDPWPPGTESLGDDDDDLQVAYDNLVGYADAYWWALAKSVSDPSAGASRWTCLA